jgi:hypothetical protein
MKNLIEYRFNKFSQNGEDGVIEELCRRLGIGPGWFVEFGAWDGKHLSNTYNLLSNHGWRGVHIEGNPEKYNVLLRTKAAFPDRLETICAMIAIEGENQLDHLLARTSLPLDFDLLSIDIDSYDAEVWDSVSRYQPKIVVIESNNLLLPGVYQRHQPPRHLGASFSSLVELGLKKGYQLVCHTGNCFFVRKELAGKLEMDPSQLEHPEQLFDHGKHSREKLIARLRTILPQGVMNLLFAASNKWKILRRKR